MKKIMFICQGNICRSPMAMFYLRYRLKTLGLENEYQVTSAALEISTKGYDMEKKAQDELIKNKIRKNSFSRIMCFIWSLSRKYKSAD